MEDLKRWIDAGGKQYQAGIELLLKYCKDTPLKKLFSEDESEYKRNRLRQALQDLHDKIIVSGHLPENLPSPGKPSTPGIAHVGWPAAIVDPVITALYIRFKPLYSELMNIQARIYDVAIMGQKGDPNKRQEATNMAHRILELDDELDLIYYQRDYYLTEGHLPASSDPAPPTVADPYRWAIELQNTQRYLREYKNKLKKYPDSKWVIAWTQKLEQLQQEIIRLKTLLKID